jgi:hypothetical protein
MVGRGMGVTQILASGLQVAADVGEIVCLPVCQCLSLDG